MCSDQSEGAPPRASGEVVLSASALGKCYHIYARPADRLKQAFSGVRRYYREFWSLREVSFDVQSGETLGIVGRNGAGKSTLLQIIAGILASTEGEVRRKGSVFSLLELGSGFNPDFTGRENIRTNGAILGLSASQVQALAPDIVGFADLGEYIDHPVSTYSSGMYARLAMALALHLPADLLLIDEILAVGDVFFQMKCFEKVQESMDAGRTALICSHDLSAVRRYCSRVMLLAEGRLVLDGPPDDVLTVYLKSGGVLATARALTARTPAPGDSADNRAPVDAAPKTAVAGPPAAAGRHGNQSPAGTAALAWPIALAPEWRPDDEFLSLVKSARGIVLLPNGNLLVAELASHALFEITPAGRIARRWGEQGFGAGAVHDPVGLGEMPDGGVAAADYCAGRVTAFYPDGTTRPLFHGLKIGRQPFTVRFDPFGRAWVADRVDGRMRIVGRDGRVTNLLEGEGRQRYLADVTFRDTVAYAADFRNDEILIIDAAATSLVATVSLKGIEAARAPHSLGFVGGRMVVSCHDSHSLVVFDGGDGAARDVTSIDLREFLVEHPCYFAIARDRLYLSSTTLGGVTAFDISAWAASDAASPNEVAAGEGVLQ